MNSSRRVLIFVLVFGLLLGGAYLLYNRLGQNLMPDQLAVQGTQPDGQEETNKVKAPDFVVFDAKGREVRLSDYYGKPIVLNFWASWCFPCRAEMPDFQEQYLKLGHEVQFLMVNMTDGAGETVESASQFLSKNGYTFPAFFDTQSDAATVYSVFSLPTTFFIDAEGNIAARATGAIDAETLQRGIETIR